MVKNKSKCCVYKSLIYFNGNFNTRTNKSELQIQLMFIPLFLHTQIKQGIVKDICHIKSCCNNFMIAYISFFLRSENLDFDEMNSAIDLKILHYSVAIYCSLKKKIISHCVPLLQIMPHKIIYFHHNQ